MNYEETLEHIWNSTPELRGVGVTFKYRNMGGMYPDGWYMKGEFFGKEYFLGSNGKDAITTLIADLADLKYVAMFTNELKDKDPAEYEALCQSFDFEDPDFMGAFADQLEDPEIELETTNRKALVAKLLLAALCYLAIGYGVASFFEDAINHDLIGDTYAHIEGLILQNHN